MHKEKKMEINLGSLDNIRWDDFEQDTRQTSTIQYRKTCDPLFCLILVHSMLCIAEEWTPSFNPNQSLVIKGTYVH